MGPSCIAAIAYVDPGNVKLGEYHCGCPLWLSSLVWCLNLQPCLSNISAKLGIVTSENHSCPPGERPSAQSNSLFLIRGGRRSGNRPAEGRWSKSHSTLLFGIPLVVRRHHWRCIHRHPAFQGHRQNIFEAGSSGCFVATAGFLAGLFLCTTTVVEVASGLIPDSRGTDSPGRRLDARRNCHAARDLPALFLVNESPLRIPKLNVPISVHFAQLAA